LKQQPLTDAELDRLQDYLVEKSGLENAMDIAMLDGYLTAIVSGPRTILPSQWLPYVWDMDHGQDHPQFKTSQQAQRIFGWIMRHMNDIARTLNHAPEHYEPLLMENANHGDPIPIIDEWCMGFMKGVRLDEQNWSPLLTKDPKLFEILTLYGTEAGFERLLCKKYSLAQHKQFAEGLADTVRIIHAYWLKQRLPPTAH
jgi:uncharacterized protein